MPLKLFRPPVPALALAVLVSTVVVGQTTKPIVNAVMNVASYAGGPISPGEMVIVFGSGMGPPTLARLQLDQPGRVGNSISGVRVLFDGTPAPLVYVSDKQIAAMVPYGLTGKATTQVQVIYHDVASDLFQRPVASSAPGIFTADASGKGQAAATNSDVSYNSPANPAAPGTWVTFYLTGEGQTNPPGSDGSIAASAANMTLPVAVLIAGRTAKLLYAGSAPGNINGFCQINAVIPADLQYGGNLPLVVQIGGVSSQIDVTLAVSGPPAPIPGAPHNPAASVNSSGQVVLAWTPADSLSTRFRIERQIAGTGFNEIALIQATATTFTDPNVTAGTTYQYRLRAESDYGVSAYSAVVSATVPAAQLLPPSTLQAVAVSQTQINLIWSATNTNATRFHIERKTGAAGTYAEITVVPGTSVSYQDTTVLADTAYVYRLRSEGATGYSAYTNESSATTPASKLPPAPALKGTATSSSQIHLSWTNTATGVVRFRVERRPTTGVYTEISQPSATSTSFDDSGLSASTTYQYRMRVEAGPGISAYSNEVTVATLQALPAAPTNLQAMAVSSSQVNLTWINNARDAIAIRVESQTAGTATFTDIGPAATLASTAITNLQPNTTYNFRVRAQSTVGYSAYSNVITASAPTTVFLVHGIGQGSQHMQSLKETLLAPGGLDRSRFVVDLTFDYSSCAANTFCSSSCTIDNGGSLLATRVLANTVPGSNIIIVGYSLGGLIARDMLVNNYQGVTTTRHIQALLTLGTPNLGYPYGSFDSLGVLGGALMGIDICPGLMQQMASDFRAQQSSRVVQLSPYLLTLARQWNGISFGSSVGSWLAVSGGYCKNPIRTGDLTNSVGCPIYNPVSDGVVCDQSARNALNGPNGPTETWYGDGYAHTSVAILCGFTANRPFLYDPVPGDSLTQKLWSTINSIR